MEETLLMTTGSEAKRSADTSDGRAKRNGNGSGKMPHAARSLPLLKLPPRTPKPIVRPVQSDIPESRAVRDRLQRIAFEHVDSAHIVPPLGMAELRELAVEVRQIADVDATHDGFISVLVNNAIWRDALAQIPYDRRLLLLPKCLRIEEHCPAPFDEFGLLCKECGLCSLHDLTVEAERLGYAVLVAEGSPIVRSMIEAGRIEAIVGVSCLNVLERCFPHLESTVVPSMAIPLLQDDCVNTTVDLDRVWDVIHLTSDDRTYRLNLDALKEDVQSWFAPDSLEDIMGSPDGETEQIAHQWLARAGKRWRPYLTTCVYLALKGDRCENQPPIPDDLKKLAVAVECFHKASLIHDDIEDDDSERYGVAALHVEFGMPVALNVGDFLLGEGYRLIGEVEGDPALALAMLRNAAEGHLTLSRGQGAELCWTRHPQPLTSLQVLDIFRQKTAPAFEVALRLGAFLGGADAATHEVLREYSESLGIAYQIRDDIEDFSGESDSNDLRDMRPSVILSIALRRAKGEGEKDLVASLWTRTCSYEDVADELDRILTERGVTAKAKELCEAYTEQSVRSLRTLTNATLKGLLRRVVGKIFDEIVIEGYCNEFEARNASGSKVGAEPAA